MIGICNIEKPGAPMGRKKNKHNSIEVSAHLALCFDLLFLLFLSFSFFGLFLLSQFSPIDSKLLGKKKPRYEDSGLFYLVVKMEL